ncbi:MAG: hypothetical protein CVT60_04665 [Actinobacteria bacterium HGW-Actinobacteria-10]|nr:MAG: hypothetical protein CVT60_04665 [Actinobacteria bacterium HGW-Actinobacteria-10]
MRSGQARHFIDAHGLWLAPATVLLATLAFLPMRPLLGSEQWGWPYMLVVGLVASTWGVGLAIFSSVLAFFLWNFMFITPYYTLHVDRSGDLVHLLAFLVVALAVGSQTGRLRESSEAARLQASRTAALYRLSSHMVQGISTAEMADKVNAEVRRVLDHATTAIWVCLSQDSNMLSPLPGAAPQAVTAYSFEAVKHALEDPDGKDIFTTRDSTFLRLSTTSCHEGFLQIHGYTNLGEDDTLFATSVAHLVAVYLENRHMSEVAMQASAAQEAERLRTALISSVSHELKTPVASLTASVTDLIGRETTPSSDELKESLTAMTADLSRLDRSIGNLLDASRLEAQAWKPTPTRFEVGELIGSVVNQLPRELRARIAFTVPEGIPSIRADFVQVTRALRHLVDNALQYSADTVTVGADFTEVGLVRTWVADNGPGIAHHEQETCDDTARRACKRCEADRRSGCGDLVSAASRRILVIDDEPQILRALKAILSSRGFQVDEADSGAAAMDVLLEHTPDLIVLDLSLPDVDGIELCTRFRTWLTIPIIVLSVRSDESDKIAALETGADDYVTKPFSAGELVARINALLRRTSSEPSAPVRLELDSLVIDLARHEVLVDDAKVTLTPIEFEILGLLVLNADRLVTWKQLAAAVWGADDMVDTRTIRVHVSNLRHKIEPHPTVPQYIMTEPGVGLRLITR